MTESPLDRRWKFPVVPMRVRREFLRPAMADIDAIGKFSVTDLSDAVGRMYTLHGLSSLFQPAISVAGPAFTVKCPPGDNFALKVGLTMTAPGDVVVVDAQGFGDWCLGGFQMLIRAINERGLGGLIVNGAYRDVAEAAAAKFPIYATSVATWSGPKLGSGEINVPVCCGGVIVEPGDVISASDDGLVVVPQRYLALVLSHLRGRENRSINSDEMVRSHDELHLKYLNEISRLGRLDESFNE